MDFGYNLWIGLGISPALGMEIATIGLLILGAFFLILFSRLGKILYNLLYCDLLGRDLVFESGDLITGTRIGGKRGTKEYKLKRPDGHEETYPITKRGLLNSRITYYCIDSEKGRTFTIDEKSDQVNTKFSPRRIAREIILSSNELTAKQTKYLNDANKMLLGVGIIIAVGVVGYLLITGAKCPTCQTCGAVAGIIKATTTTLPPIQ